LTAQKKADIQSDLLPVIEAVPLQMNQLFYNLISNALKFTRKGVSPLIAIAANKLSHEKKCLYPQLNVDKNYYEIKFRDNGIGFNQEYANKIFTIFQRLNERNMFSGYGIGLSICSKVVSNHQGIIFAEGQEQEGATFTVVIPLQQ
jgi:two-component system CheB/CheR fusion protein